MADRLRARRLRRIRVVVAVAVCLLIAGGGAAWAMSGSSGATYRTATVGTASITETLDSVGVVHAVNKAVVSFPVSGRVATVPVSLGETVQAGQVLATLDTSSLTQAVQQADQTVAQDQLKLADDETGQTSSGSGSSSTGSRSSGSGTGAASSLAAPDSASVTPLTTGGPKPTTGAPTRSAPSGSTPGSSGGAQSGSGTPAAVTAAQQQLIKDQKALDQILSEDALADLRALVASDGPCAMTPPRPTSFVATTDSSGTITVTTPQAADVTAGQATVGAPVSGADGDTVTITGAPSTSYTVTITPAVGSIDATACTSAIQNVVSVLAGPGDNAWTIAQAITTDELTLSRAITALERSASSGSSRSSGTGQSGTGQSGTGQSGTGRSSAGSSVASGSNTSGAGSGGGSVASPEQLAADQAAVDAAEAELAVAQQNLAQAQIRSPIAGIVADVGLTAGSSAGSNAITVIGSGTYDVATTVSLTDLDLMKVGDTAIVRVDGIGAPLAGKVTMIGVLDSTTGSTTTFPVTVALDPTSARLFDGAGADVEVTVAQVDGALSVPSSAVHSVGALHTVTVLSGGKQVLTRVGVGAVGTDRTQITSGLEAGQRVVLAQLNAPLPGTGTATTGRRAVTGLTGGGGLGGGGLGGGLGGGTRLGG